MRARISALVVAIVFAGCSSGTRTVYVVRDRPVPPPPPAAPPPVVFQPLEIALGRPSARNVPVQTNRAAYVAIFEITPREGVILVHPSTPRQTRMVLSGLSFVPVWWESQPTGGGRANDARPPRPTRYIYALASERPLRLLDSAFVPGYLERVLGPGGLRAAAPQPAMRALARHFAAAAVSGRWAEDLYTLAPSTEASPRRVARIYCPGGTIYEVPEDIADRAWCPVQGQNTAGNTPPTQPATGPAPARPDSVVGPTGRLVNRRIGDALRRAVGHQESDSQPGDKDKAAKAKADKEKADKDKADKDKAEKDKADKDRIAKDQAGKERADAEKADRDRAEKDKGEKEKRDQLQAEADRVAKDHAEKERAEKEHVERERAGKEKAEKEKFDKEKADKAAKEQGEREKADKEKADREAANAVAARESVEAERVRVEKENAEKEKAEKEKAEKDKAEKEKAEKVKAEKDQADKEKAEKVKAEKDQADKEKAEKDKAEKDKAEKDKADKDGKRTGPPKAGPPTR